MQKVMIHIKPSNGLSLPEIGHLTHGKHELEVSTEQLAMLKTAEGLSISEDETAQKTSNVTQLQSVTNTKPEDAETLAIDIREVIAHLDPDDESLWTKSGKAKTEAIEAMLGYQISAAERDAALKVD